MKNLSFGREVLSSEAKEESKGLAEERMEHSTPHNRVPAIGGPILLVCYTNHALDQFLEGILEFSNPDGRYLSHYCNKISDKIKKYDRLSNSMCGKRS